MFIAVAKNDSIGQYHESLSVKNTVFLDVMGVTL
jgi:hypothetical protein